MEKKILVVDDNKDGAESLSLLLGFLGYSVRVAYDGIEALSIADSFKPGLIILDINMPVMDGYAVARCIRQANAQPRVMLIAHTARASEADKATATAAGFDAHLKKPAALSTITRHLDEVFPPLDDKDKQ